MRRSLSVALLGVLLAALAGTAWGYTLMEWEFDPPLNPPVFMRIGDLSLPYVYHIHYGTGVDNLPGDREYEIIRESFDNWHHQPENVDIDFVEGEEGLCGFHYNWMNEVSFEKASAGCYLADCTGGVLGITYTLRPTSMPGDGFYTTGTDSIFTPILESDFIFCEGWWWDDPDVDWHPCPGGNHFDTGGVGTHEIGHMLGLDHSQYGPATMYAYIAGCDSTKRSLYFDDKRATRVTYRNRDLLGYADHDNFNGVFSVTNCANLAYTGSGSAAGPGIWGEGFIWPADSVSHIYECSMAFGTMNSRVSDNFRTTEDTPEDDDIIQRSDMAAFELGTYETAFGTWDDSMNDEPPYGIKVLMQSYSFPDPPDDDYVIIFYWLINESATTYTNLRAGIFTDFDLNGTYQHNSVDYDADIGLGWVSDPSTPLQAGWKVLNPEGVVTYRALYSSDSGAQETYTDANKTSWFNSGFTRTSLNDTDIVQLIVTGDFVVLPGDTAFAAFALVAGDDHADLRANALAAQAKYVTLSHDPDLPTGVEEGVVRLPISLAQNKPNPFGPTTRISFSLRETMDVNLIVIDPAGRVVRRLVDEPLAKGHHNYIWDGRDDRGREVSAGVYFYSLSTQEGRLSKKMVLVR